MNTLKLSEAIRLGSALRPQAFGDYYVGGGSCAYGAAYEAIGKGTSFASERILWPVIEVLDVSECPDCGQWLELGILPEGIIPHLNDYHKWTRERIADWVESIEKQQEEVQPVPQSCWDCSERIEDGVHDCPLKEIIL